MGLNGIDISSWQDDLVVSAMGTCDFVIVKATGGMREMFVGSGLFSWQAVTANAERGDIYLDEENHTAMALGGGKIGHFTGSETGGLLDCCVGSD